MSSNPNTESAKPESLERLDPSKHPDHEASQHWARYDWACGFLPRGRVLDCACGLGYGSALLREQGADQVVGVDMSEEAIASARQHYARPGIEYVCSDALALRPEDVGTFDLIVSLETIEHVAEPHKLLDLFRSLLNPDGLLAISCPNDRHLGVQNEFHEWVAEFDELRSWLEARFAHVDCYGELHLAGTAVWSRQVMEERPDPAREYALRLRLLDSLPMADAAGFLLACGQQPPPAAEARGALLLDGIGYVRELLRACGELRAEATRLGAAWEEQTARVRELDEMTKRVWNELQKVDGRRQTLQGELDQLLEAQRVFERQLPCRILRKIGVLKPIAPHGAQGPPPAAES